MERSIDLVRRTAALARLELDAAVAARLAPQFERILRAFEKLSEVAVEDESGADEGLATRTRPDELRASLPVDDVLAAAPRRIDDFFGVPKTIEDAS
jgi:aspartyl-tRNA(Asn)/glutamyl-tRNA(Gln) amidotransferase subunit C